MLVSIERWDHTCLYLCICPNILHVINKLATISELLLQLLQVKNTNLFICSDHSNAYTLRISDQLDLTFQVLQGVDAYKSGISIDFINFQLLINDQITRNYSTCHDPSKLIHIK